MKMDLESQLIDKLKTIQETHGDIHIALTSKPGQQWHGLLDLPEVVTVKKNLYKACYEKGEDEKICTL